MPRHGGKWRSRQHAAEVCNGARCIFSFPTARRANGCAGHSHPPPLQSGFFVFLAPSASKSVFGSSNTCALVLVIDAIPYRARTFVSHSRKVHEFRPVDVNEAPEEFTVPRLFQKPVFADLRRVCPTVKRVDPKCPENRRFRPKLDPKKILRALRLWPKKAQRLGKPPQLFAATGVRKLRKNERKDTPFAVGGIL